MFVVLSDRNSVHFFCVIGEQSFDSRNHNLKKMKLLRFFYLGAILLASYSSLKAQELSFQLPLEMHLEELSVTLVKGLDPDGSAEFAGGQDKTEPKSKTDLMQRSVNLSGIEGYRMLSSPVATDYATLLAPLWTQGATGSNNPGGDANIWTWDLSGGGQGSWSPLVGMQDPIVPGSGFLVYVFEDDDPDDHDNPGGFPKTLTVEGPENEDGVVGDVNPHAKGWTLLGNPFDAPIRFADLTRQNLTDVIYVWDVNDDANGSNGGDSGGDDGGDAGPGAGNWKTYSLSAGAGDNIEGIIAGFQGFFVQNTTDGNGEVIFPASAKTTGGSFYGKQAPADVIRLELSGQGMNSSAWLSFREKGSFDEVAGDAHKLDPLSQHFALLAGIKNGNPYDISILTIPEEDFAFPISAEATIGGTYTLSVTNWDVTFDEALFLVDRLEQTVVELTPDTGYEFELDAIAAKSIADPLAWISGGLSKAPAVDQPRFVITSDASVHGEVPAELPAELALSQNYPNPFNPSTLISYALPEQAHVRLAIYDLTGRRISTLVNEEQSPGEFNVTWDASGLASGVYIYRLEAAGQTLTQSMTLIK